MADQATFAEQAMEFMPSLYSAALRMTRNAADAEDLVQETYLQGLPGLRRLRGGHEPQGLALPDPHQHVHQHATGPRSAGPTRPTSTTSRTSTCTGGSAASRRPWLGRSAEDELLERFTDDEVKAALEALPEQFRMAVLLADVEGFSLQGDRRDPRHPDRHRDEPAAPGKKRPAEAVVRVRCRTRARSAEQSRDPIEDDLSIGMNGRLRRRRCASSTTYLDGELDDEPRGRDPAPPRRLPACLEAFDFEPELRS